MGAVLNTAPIETAVKTASSDEQALSWVEVKDE
jgi:hypothetical protein